MNRLYAVESTPTNTGAMADHRLRMRASDIEGFARALARELGVNAVAAPAAPPNVPAGWIPALARDLKQHPGATLVVAGDQQPPIVHALAHAINQALGNFDKTVYFTAADRSLAGKSMGFHRPVGGGYSRGKRHDVADSGQQSCV